MWHSQLMMLTVLLLYVLSLLKIKQRSKKNDMSIKKVKEFGHTILEMPTEIGDENGMLKIARIAGSGKIT